jgi:hypothetical protein
MLSELLFTHLNSHDYGVLILISVEDAFWDEKEVIEVKTVEES